MPRNRRKPTNKKVQVPKEALQPLKKSPDTWQEAEEEKEKKEKERERERERERTTREREREKSRSPGKLCNPLRGLQRRGKDLDFFVLPVAKRQKRKRKERERKNDEREREREK